MRVEPPTAMDVLPIMGQPGPVPTLPPRGVCEVRVNATPSANGPTSNKPHVPTRPAGGAGSLVKDARALGKRGAGSGVAAPAFENLSVDTKGSVGPTFDPASSSSETEAAAHVGAGASAKRAAAGTATASRPTSGEGQRAPGKGRGAGAGAAPRGDGGTSATSAGAGGHTHAAELAAAASLLSFEGTPEDSCCNKVCRRHTPMSPSTQGSSATARGARAGKLHSIPMAYKLVGPAAAAAAAATSTKSKGSSSSPSGPRVCTACYTWIRRHFHLYRGDASAAHHKKCDATRRTTHCDKMVQGFLDAGVKFVSPDPSSKGDSRSMTAPAATPSSSVGLKNGRSSATPTRRTRGTKRRRTPKASPSTSSGRSRRGAASPAVSPPTGDHSSAFKSVSKRAAPRGGDAGVTPRHAGGKRAAAGTDAPPALLPPSAVEAPAPSARKKSRRTGPVLQACDIALREPLQLGTVRATNVQDVVDHTHAILVQAGTFMQSQKSGTPAPQTSAAMTPTSAAAQFNAQFNAASLAEMPAPWTPFNMFSATPQASLGRAAMEDGTRAELFGLKARVTALESMVRLQSRLLRSVLASDASRSALPPGHMEAMRAQAQAHAQAQAQAQAHAQAQAQAHMQAAHARHAGMY